MGGGAWVFAGVSFRLPQSCNSRRECLEENPSLFFSASTKDSIIGAHWEVVKVPLVFDLRKNWLPELIGVRPDIYEGSRLKTMPLF
jgi:hypothetical protein